MLQLKQASEANSESIQAYKVGILAKIVKALLKAHMMVSLEEDVKVLFVWTLGSVMQVIQLIWKLKNIWFISLDPLDRNPLDPG